MVTKFVVAVEFFGFDERAVGPDQFVVGQVRLLRHHGDDPDKKEPNKEKGRKIHLENKKISMKKATAFYIAFRFSLKRGGDLIL
jgi:hypothetical protein